LKKRIAVVFLLATLMAWILPPAKTVASQTKTKTTYIPEEITSGDITIKDNAIQPSGANQTGVSSVQTVQERKGVQNAKRVEPLRTQTNGRNYSKEEVQQLIRDYAAQYGISADLPLRVANCESGFNQFSKNKNSTASGVAQYLSSTWAHTEAGKAGISVFDAEANVHMMIKSISNGGISNWSASKSCWNRM
jgi:hypothetical protein